jgi:BMFP domain-containing protein YqiC
MRSGRLLLLVAATTAFLGPIASAQSPPAARDPSALFGDDLDQQLRQRQDQIDRLPVGEREQFQAAQKKALETSEVRAALKKREEAVRSYRETLRKSMLESDPAIAGILEKLLEERAKQSNRRASRPAKR